MASEDVAVLVCDQCGATVYPEHLKQHKAQKIEGRLLCPHCLIEVSAPPPPVATGAPGDPTEVPVQLVDDEAEEEAAEAASQIRQFGASFSFDGGAREDGFRRALLPDARNATRCRTFHAKLTDASLAHLNDTINEWVDAHADVQIKFVSSNIGVVEGKHADPHLIVTVFY